MKNIFRYSIYLLTVLSMLILITMLMYLFIEAYPFFKGQKLSDFILGNTWRASEPHQSFQIFNILYAGFYISNLKFKIYPMRLFGYKLKFLNLHELRFIKFNLSKAKFLNKIS